MTGQNPLQPKKAQPFYYRTLPQTLCILLLLSLQFNLAKAADNGAVEHMDDVFAMSLEELLDMEVVTASLQPEPLSDAIASTYVITAEQIRAMGARTIYDALTHVPGLTISGNKGGANKLFSRGMGSRFSAQFLLLLDNHIINAPITGDAMSGRYDRLPIANIKRIEVVQGPGSSLYGGNAFLGMINVITKKGDDVKGSEVSVRTEFDNNGQAVDRYNILYGEQYENDWQFSINLNFLDGDGVERWVNQDGLGQSGEADTSEKNYDLNINLSSKRFNINGRYYNSEAGDAFGIAYILTENSKLENEHGFVDSSYEIISSQDLSVMLRGSADTWTGEHYYVISDPDSAIGYNSYKVTADAYAYTGELRSVFTGISQHQVMSGLSYRYEEIKNSTFWISDVFDPNNWLTPTDRNIWAIYINDKYQINNAIQATIAGRYDHYSDFGGSFNPRIGLSWQVNPKYKLKIQYGTAFRAPDFVSLYSTNNPLAKPNPDLNPEEITTWEAGVVAHLNPQLLMQATLFRSKVEDLIGVGSVGSIKWENTNYVTSKGVELSFRYDVTPRLHLSGNYTYAHLDFSVNYQQPTVPEHSGSLTIDYQINNNIKMNVNSFGQGSSPRASGDPRSDLSGFILVNSTLTAKINQHIEAQLSVYNLTDKRYAYPAPTGTLIDDYTAPARSFLMGMLYRF